MRRAYGFEEVAIVPGEFTINPEQTDTTFYLGDLAFSLPILAAAMDAIVTPDFAIGYDKLGGLSVLNLEGVNTRYEKPADALSEIVEASPNDVTSILQRVYSEPIKEKLVGDCVRSIKQAGARCAVSVTPANTKWLAPVAVEAGADVLVVQSTVTTTRHYSKSVKGLRFAELCQQFSVPIAVGNCASYGAALELMRTGVAGIMIGVGPGAACTTREVLGIGVPQVTATMDCAAARDHYYHESGRYVSIITDGGIRNGGELCKAIVAGADAVMLGAVFAQMVGAAGGGYHWGMAQPHPNLPRGTRIKVGANGTLSQILFGPTSVTDGSQNLVGALRTAMGVCGYSTIREMHNAEMVVAPAIKTEGKSWQMSRSL